ncbi:26S proteasome regulatory subunit [Theileria orientalis strain Shintoku]|uniref:26S proteasome regulatory subunit n=1 Tax=Theileria orientalis strain Shintoku TaxID=869250 RepID=J4D9S0_THEOR|nr:26S proteasome regulatory subunit [Theileria orientalis strain Shintoku]BAM41560.1 26S proteasome regulatory subunit [Theileria orientalis strain Shintoku]|eukprot:XP_009691861.1 26S proteasome regulatory subunit [Theileria orientalis strain Shintoku]
MDQFDLHLSQLQKAYQTNFKSTKFETCLFLIDKLKDFTAHYNLSNPNVDKESLLKIRTFLETAALIFLEANDTENFKSLYSQLQPFYFDLNNILPKSEHMTTILSMWMLHLLSDNKIGDLYMLLEKIPNDVKQDDKIAFVINLERLMMEGNLHQLLELDTQDGTPPQGRTASRCHDRCGSEYYKIIASTARNKIASSIELCYRHLSLDYVSNLLKLKNRNETLDFISYYNQYKLQQDPESVPWKVADNYVIFQNEVGAKHKIPSRELLSNSLEYLHDLEKII